jgi:hypothetical protein
MVLFLVDSEIAFCMLGEKISGLSNCFLSQTGELAQQARHDGRRMKEVIMVVVVVVVVVIMVVVGNTRPTAQRSFWVFSPGTAA